MGCSGESNTDRLIREYMEANLKDPSSYEIISTSEPDSAFYIGAGSDAYKVWEDMYDEYKRKSDYELMSMNPDVEMARIYQESMAEAIQEMEKLAKVKEWTGWKVKHEYRAKNAMGALVKQTTTFYFDKEMSKIEDAKNVSIH